MYGLRNTHPALFFLSPWEFTQWIKPVRLLRPGLQPPNSGKLSDSWSTWTPSGREKWKRYQKGEAVQFDPFKDYVLNDAAIAACKYVFPFLPGKIMFQGKEPAQYEEFRHTWILLRRQPPVVPCPEQCPLPSKRMSKNERSKIFQIYLRPWTEGTGVATRTVPHLKDLGKFTDDAAMCAEPGAAEIPATEKNSMRKTWKAYLTHVLPHAKRQLTNFMLACNAEGRATPTRMRMPTAEEQRCHVRCRTRTYVPSCLSRNEQTQRWVHAPQIPWTPRDESLKLHRPMPRLHIRAQHRILSQRR